MAITKTIEVDGRSYPINFLVGTNVVPAAGDRPGEDQLTATALEQGIDHLVEALRLIPEAHISYLTKVPIMIVTVKPGGRRGGGGWYPPAGARTSMAVWMRPAGVRRTHIAAADIEALPHARGIIAVPTNRIKQPGLRQFTILHEVGHCVDYHGEPGRPGHGLDSLPRDASYRRGNRAYQGQKYGQDAGYNQYEFKAEAYSRLFLRPTRMCRQARANPICTNHAGHSRCNERLQRDFAASPAFRSLGAEGSRCLPLVDAATFSTGGSASGEGDQSPHWKGGRAPGPISESTHERIHREHLAARASGRIPGPMGRWMRS
jgi:hypothetical protein